MDDSEKNISRGTPRRSGSRWRAVLLLSLVFLLGIACGLGGGGLWLRHRIQATLQDPASAPAPAARILERIEERITEELSLEPAERALVGAQLDEAAGALRALRTQSIRSARDIVETTERRIAEALPAEKRARFREFAREGLRPWGFAPEGR